MKMLGSDEKSKRLRRPINNDDEKLTDDFVMNFEAFAPQETHRDADLIIDQNPIGCVLQQASSSDNEDDCEEDDCLPVLALQTALQLNNNCFSKFTKLLKPEIPDKVLKNCLLFLNITVTGLPDGGFAQMAYNDLKRNLKQSDINYTHWLVIHPIDINANQENNVEQCGLIEGSTGKSKYFLFHERDFEKYLETCTCRIFNRWRFGKSGK
ncbi:hypothetical protein GJ496_000615 [Pomphorhynchus laevis]|nr:hypothetical protein GJ496_000615 [Pomphorhynchus laevis]